MAGLFHYHVAAQKSYDSLHVSPPKHYFNTVFSLDGYGKPSVNLNSGEQLDKKLQTYAVKQYNVSFYIPVYTHDSKGSGRDSAVINNLHVLVTGNFFRLQPVFGGIPQHNLVKRGVGARVIYNTGKRGVWFIDAAPFITRDISYNSKPYLRFATTIVYSYNVTDRLNWRFGATKSFLWGNRLYLPFIGFRFGRLDKINLSIQFPRSASLNFPLSRSFVMSLYTRPQGGMFNFSNHDTLYPKTNVTTFHFTRYEINTGLRFDVRLGNHFVMFASAGLSTGNHIVFYSDKANTGRSRLPYNTYFYNAKTAPTLFVQYGLLLRFGKTRSYYNNRNIYDAIDLNDKAGTYTNNLQIPLQPRNTPKNLNLESVRDLIDYNDDF